MKALAVNCPECGQALTSVRYGVVLRPLWVRIVDAIARCPDGIARENLTWLVYGTRTVTRNAISMHIHNINIELLATDFQIAGGRAGYRIVRTRTPDNV